MIAGQCEASANKSISDDDKVFFMKVIRFLFKKIRQYDPKMLLMLTMNAVTSALYPFIWVFVPVLILRYYQSWKVSQLALLIGAAAVGAALFGFVAEWLKGNYRMRMNNVRYHLIRDLTEASLRMPYQNTLYPETLDRIEFARNTVSSPHQGAGGIMLTLLPLFGEILAALGFIGVLSAVSPWMIPLILLLLASYFLAYRKQSSFEVSTFDAAMPVFRQTDTMSAVAQDPLRKKDILLYNSWNVVRSYLRDLADKNISIIRALVEHQVNMNVFLAFVELIRDVVVFGWLTYLFVLGRIDAALFVLYTGSLLSFMVVMQSLVRDLVAVQLESVRFSSYLKFIDEVQNQIDSETASNKITPQAVTQAEISMEDLSFTYPNSESAVLSSLNLTIHPGEKLALVGENGAGKSTLVKLLCRLYRPTEGRILMNGIDIWDYPEDEYFSLLSVVFQDAIIFPFSIKENVSMGLETNASAYQNALEQSGLYETVQKTPKGDDTSMLRVLDDEGIELSGGQKQKLFLARALYKTTGRFLILDEPTAALDALAEKELYERFATFTEGKTSVFVSHRLASTRFCDNIAYLKDGKIVELGSHNELIALKGEYQQLFEIQARNYRQGNTAHTNSTIATEANYA